MFGSHRIPDVIAVCASNERQAKHFRALIDRRIQAGLYPRELTFAVTHDPPGGRVGSGGGTLHALSQIEEQLGSWIREAKVLLIHAGGESRRMPTYAPEGKLFMPLPVPSSSIIPPVLFDLQLSLYMRYPWRRGELVVASGDVAVDMDPAEIPEERGDICGFAKSVPLEVGANHGVYRFASNRRNVTGFFQKASVDFLGREAGLEDGSRCALDVGTIAFSPKGREALASLGSVTADSRSLSSRVASGESSFDLYLEIITGALPGLSLEEYLALVSERSRLSEAELEEFYTLLQSLELSGVLSRRGRFLHFGSIPDYQESAAELASQPVYPFYYSGEEQFELLPEAPQQEEFVHDPRTVDGEAVTVVYGRDDTWRPVAELQRLRYCGLPMSLWLEERGLSAEDLFPDSEGPFDLYEARLFSPVFDEGFLAGFTSAHVDPDWTKTFRGAKRLTLREINEATNPLAREAGLMDKRRQLLRERLLSGRGWLSMSHWDFGQLFGPEDLPTLRTLASRVDDDLVRVYRNRLVTLLEPAERREGTFAVNYLSHLTSPPELQVSVKEDQIVWARSPVRLDLAGGWTDTPPYTLREGGAVCNVAVDLNGQPPIQVFCRPLEEPVVRMHSIDLGITETYTTFEEIEGYGDPDTNFALPKAGLSLLGFGSESGTEDLAAFLRSLGGGIELTLLSAIPKGSGLGTSSIIGATVLAALERFYGIYDEGYLHSGELYRQVLQMEQMLTTGGGWQDQIGGAAGGVKYVESAPGLRPDPKVYQLDPFLFEDPASLGRMTLYYTGATRLAKNILQEVVDGFNGMSPSYLFTVRRIGNLAQAARQAVATRDMETLSEIIAESWRENRLIHPSTTNEEIESLLHDVGPYFQSVKLLGAGGGGFALFASDSTESAADLRRALDRYAAEHGNRRARRVDFGLNKAGLQVTVS